MDPDLDVSLDTLGVGDKRVPSTRREAKTTETFTRRQSIPAAPTATPGARPARTETFEALPFTRRESVPPGPEKPPVEPRHREPKETLTVETRQARGAAREPDVREPIARTSKQDTQEFVTRPPRGPGRQKERGR